MKHSFAVKLLSFEHFKLRLKNNERDYFAIHESFNSFKAKAKRHSINSKKVEHAAVCGRIQNLSSHIYREAYCQFENSAGISGILADIIAVKGNPLEDITLLEKVEFVMKNGKVYKQPQKRR